MTEWKGKTRGGVLGYKIFVWTLRNLGLRFAYFMLRFVVIWFLFTSGKAVRSMYHYFHTMLGYNPIRAFTGIVRNYYLFGQILLDKIAMLAGFQAKFTFDFEGEEHLRGMTRGGLLISAHIGNWEIAGQLLNRLERKINIILFDAEHERIKGYLSDVMVNRNVHFIVIRDNYSHLEEIRNALAAGEIIAMHGDRYIEGNKTVTMEFLGRPAAFPIGPLNLAARFGVPATFVFALKERPSHYHFYATPPVSLPFTRNLMLRESILGDALRVYVSRLEEMVHRYPLQWFNYYNFWKLPVVAGAGMEEQR